MWWYTSQAMLGITLHISTSQRRTQRSLGMTITHRQLLPPRHFQQYESVQLRSHLAKMLELQGNESLTKSQTLLRQTALTPNCTSWPWQNGERLMVKAGCTSSC